MHWGPGVGWILMLLGGAALLLFFILVVLLIVLWLVSRSRRTTSGGAAVPGAQTPLEILQARYARGEITREEYLEMREHLRQEEPPR